MSCENVYFDEDGNPEYSGHRAKEEPDCPPCGDSGRVRVDVMGVRVEWWDDNAYTRVVNCPDCNPTPAQRVQQLAEAKQTGAEFAARVARGEVTFADEPPF